MNVHAPINARAYGIQATLQLADDLHVISRDAYSGGELYGILPIFRWDPLDGSEFYACFRVWPCSGPSLRKAGARWSLRNHVSVVYLKSSGRCAFVDKKLTDRIQEIFLSELEFIRCPLTHCHADEFQARMAIGGPRISIGVPRIVYSAIPRCRGTNCLAQVIGRILKNLFMLLCDHEYIPYDVDMQTVTLHMQFHERVRPALAQRLRDAPAGPEDLKQYFEAWAALVKLTRQGAAAVPSPPATPMPTRPCPSSCDPWGPDLVPRPRRTAADFGRMD